MTDTIEKRMSKLPVNRLQPAAHYRTHYAAVVDENTTIEDLTREDYWSHVAMRLRQMDVIDVLAEDNSFYAELLVLQAGTGFAKVMLLREVKLDESLTDEGADERFSLVWKGPHRKWAVMRNSDKEILRDTFVSKEQAHIWRRDHVKALAA